MAGPVAAGTPDLNTLLTGGAIGPQAAPQFVIAPVVPAVTPPPAAPASSTGYQSAAGPWGTIIGDYIYLEAPASLVETFALPSSQPQWVFPATVLPNLSAFFQEAGLTQEQINGLMAPSKVVKDGDRVTILPTIEFIEQLSAATRLKIYSELGKSPENEYHAEPVLMFDVPVKEWFAHSKLRPELIEKIAQLSYTRGETTAFSDIPVLLHYAQSDAEARIIFKACTRTRALMVRLKLDENSDIAQLLSYWSFGTGIRRKDIEPLLRSIVESSTLHDLGLSHIMPALPRKLLYTYPGLDMGKNGILPDCHWTSLNFYNFDAHQYLLDANLATSQVLSDFVPVEPPYEFGDILFFLSQEGDAFHSCVHLADTLVFTKNGRNVLAPWVIMTLDNVKKIYLYKDGGRVQAYRRKDIQDARREAASAGKK